MNRELDFGWESTGVVGLFEGKMLFHRLYVIYSILTILPGVESRLNKVGYTKIFARAHQWQDFLGVPWKVPNRTLKHIFLQNEFWPCSVRVGATSILLWRTLFISGIPCMGRPASCSAFETFQDLIDTIGTVQLSLNFWTLLNPRIRTICNDPLKIYTQPRTDWR